jgi:hypothetical protein
MDTGRLEQFKVTKQVYDKMPQKMEFVIATRSKVDVAKYLKENKLSKGVRLISYTISSGFNPAKGLNIAVKNAKYPTIIITSPEVKPTYDTLEKLEKEIGKNVVCQVYDENEDHTIYSLVHKGFRDENPAMYFLAMFNKSDIEKINGWDMDFMKGYAYEDNDFGSRWARAGIPWKLREDITALHQWHPRSETIPNGSSINMNKYFENIDNNVTVCANGLNKI